MLSTADFTQFMKAVTGHTPFAWQQRLLQHIVDNGQWPAAITAPTGAGKTVVVPVHVFATAMSAQGSAPRLPRRLALVVNRRGLVDSQEQVADGIKQALENPSDGVVAEVAEALQNLNPGSRLEVTNLRGGLTPDHEWLLTSGGCHIICTTPQMSGSALLMRAYGASPQARPRLAGLLAMDTALVLDEAHLNQQFLVTARRVAELSRRDSEQLNVPGLQVVEASATALLAPGEQAVSITPEDLATEPFLAQRLTNPKPLRYREIPETKGNHTKKVIEVFVEEIQTMRDRLTEPGTVGCIVNTVKTAVEITAMLQKDGVKAVSWVGRMRPLDLTRLKEEHPGLFTVDGDADVEVLVATQTVEVGVDIDLHGLVTELAPGSALAQRFGRVNRLGSRPDADLVVLGPKKPARDSSIYTAAELQAAHEWIMAGIESDTAFTPATLAENPPPPALPRRMLFSRLELGNVDYLSNTSGGLFEEPDLELWLSDDLEAPTAEGGLIVRGPLGNDETSLGLLRATPPAPREVFPVVLHRLQKVVDHVLETGKQRRVFLWRLGELTLHHEQFTLQPGDLVVVDSDLALFKSNVVVDPREGKETAKPVWGGQGTTVVLVDDPEPLPDGRSADDLLEELASLSRQEAIELLQQLNPQAQDFALPDAVEELSLGRTRFPWVVWRTGATTEEDQQMWTPAMTAVSLDQHATAVAARAEQLGHRVGLPRELTEALRLAGLHHDDGKKDPRFQRVLGADRELLAKSGFRSAQQARRAKANSGLPTGWRHEQASVLSVFDALVDESEEMRDLVARLVGTSHGRGRSSFDMVAEDLLVDPTPEAHALFTEGGWEELVQRTQERWGAWGCAYLEALLRSADGMVSKEGS
ncbi:MAG: type I-U CRISPR-associated helicase/endonuclease Cas3 [Arachnia propionica]|uniref:type I-G CRISPR-associated helicase/endonuclease Cas3g n=1 Tax=Arachnia propionica TaxID=1750 RepID=UPI0026F4DCB3|nr:type I-U CRISPR-associated helicase/endonuclease Cas3 [Arachnia propionica]